MQNQRENQFQQKDGSVQRMQHLSKGDSLEGLQLASNEQICSHPEAINIIFENINYTVQVQKKTDSDESLWEKPTQKKHILKKLTGIFKAAQVSAILGASGAGKTTLLNIVACRISHQSDGKLYANRTEYSYDTFGDFANYVMQADVLMETLTVKQTLDFAANLKLNLSEEEKERKVVELAESMKLEKCLDVMVGGQTLRGISGGERKRTSIAFQLMREPQVIVLDEPTSGLDSLTSFIIVDYLNKLAHEKGRTVLMTIHQPNTDIYCKFDRLFLMAEGQFVYQGPADQAVDYFKLNFNLSCGPYQNPAQFQLQVIHPQNPYNLRRYPQYFKFYQDHQAPLVLTDIQRVENTGLRKYQNEIPVGTTFKTLMKRDFLNIVRNPLLFRARLLQTVILGIYVGGLYFQLGQKSLTVTANWHSVTGLLFFVCITSLTTAMVPITVVFPMERMVFLKEENSRLYSVGAYFLSRNAIEVPYLVVMPLLFSLIFYWMIKLSSSARQFFIFYSIIFLINLCGNSLGLLLGSLITDARSVSAVVPILLLPFVLFSGFFKNSGNIPDWIGWIQYISPLKYGFAALTLNSMRYRDSMISLLNIDVSFSTSIALLVILSLAYRLLSLLFLWMLRTRIN